MSDIAIKVEDVSKLYRLGKIGTGSFINDLRRFWYQVKGKDDPFAKFGVTNDRTKKAESQFVWSLKDINFEVKKGDVLGIIGRNGAGKSTLLKILSKITAPTTGQISINGRIASLLEVGTGFHPELSGRENIFLNGAILGMRKWEIQKKFDEIVDFSGVEAYIDTPVKRYSSGMYVRLAFAVAAFLEPEILIVDEVLAVGDAEFQKKCLGRMKDVSVNDGRTVLFVSHNIVAVQKLCTAGIILLNGRLEFSGSIENAISEYLSISRPICIDNLLEFRDRIGNGVLRFTEIFLDQNGENRINVIDSWDRLGITLNFNIEKSLKIRSSRVDIGINDYNGTRVAWVSSDSLLVDLTSDTRTIRFEIESLNLAPGDYSFNVFCEINNEIADWLQNITPFSILDRDYYNSGRVLPKNQGGVLLKYNIQLLQ
jgi:lipopolysaccharide transport system ATP-binding protein